MFGTGYSNLYLTKYNTILKQWEMVETEDLEETKDEFKYFRVIRDSKKYFYKSIEDYSRHIKISSKQLFYLIEGEQKIEV